MPPKVIKLGKKDDIASVIKQIKSLRDREVVFELIKGSVLLSSSDNLKLLKRTGEALGKTIKVSTDDEIGRILAKKAGVLYGDAEVKMPKIMPRVARSDVKPRFSDIMGSRKIFSNAVDRAINPAPESPPAKLPRDNVRKTRSSGNFTKFFILGLVILVVAVFALAVLLPTATVTVFARSEQVTRDLELTVDKNTSSADPDNLQITGIPVDREVSQTKNFTATGVQLAGTKATGTVTIYNFTPNILTLRAATTTLVMSDKKYLFTKDVTGIKPNGVPNPGIQIIADLPGEAQNLPANSKLQIVNQKLGSQNVYAVNPDGIGGGQATSTTVLSQADIDMAVASLTNDIVAQAESDMTQETGFAVKLVPSGIKTDILAKTANKNVGDEADSFAMTLIAKVTGLGFKDSDVTSIVVSKINQVLSSDKYLLDNAQRQYTAEFKSIDIPNGHGVLAVHFVTTAAYKVDQTNLAGILAGKNETEIKEILMSKPEIDNVQVTFWPSWFTHKAPRFNGKIYIKTELSSSQ
ncbi:MAG: hypothetical protein WDN47_00260 [Candidatus Doudnabacteria bacterium]